MAETAQTPVLFQNRSQVDAVSVLMLLGEATIWKAIWGRFRSRRSHWRQWIFAISPGWTPLAATLFARMSGSLGPTNLIFDFPPEACIDSTLIMTNLNSGASHVASNTILQNIWATWNNGARGGQNAKESENVFDLTREVGITNVNLDLCHLENPTLFWFQSVCLATQVVGSLIFGLCGWSFEIFVTLLVAFVAQSLLLWSITPREKAWTKVTRGKQPCPIMLHKGLDSNAVLLVRNAYSGGRQISMEEFCWDNQACKDHIDKLKKIVAGCSFLLWVIHIILVGWMSSKSRYIYLLFGGIGLLASTIEAATEPAWSFAFRSAFSNHARCAPLHSSLMSAVAILLAGRFPSAKAASKLLYPDNTRFQKSLEDLESHINELVCTNCQQSIRTPNVNSSHQCLRIQQGNENPCQVLLHSRIRTLNSEQLADGLAAVYNYLRAMNPRKGEIPRIDTFHMVQSGGKHFWGRLHRLQEGSFL